MTILGEVRTMLERSRDVGMQTQGGFSLQNDFISDTGYHFIFKQGERGPEILVETFRVDNTLIVLLHYSKMHVKRKEFTVAYEAFQFIQSI